MLKKSIFNIIKEENGQTMIYNTFSKAMGILDKEVSNCYNENKLEKINKYVLDLMEEQGFLVNNNCDEIKELEKKYKDVRNKKDILFITLIPTMSCNFRCPYCFEGNDCKSATKTLNFDILKKFSKNNFKDLKHIHITLFGGEPLLLKKEIFNYFKYLEEINDNNFTYSSNIATNGYLLDQQTIENLVDICHCESFQITIDGNKYSHNKTRMHNAGMETYDTIMENLKNLIHYNRNIEKGNLNILLRINLLNNSLKDIMEVLNEFSDDEKEYFKIYFRPIYNTKEFDQTNENRMNLEEFYSMAKDNGFIINFGDNIRFHHCEGDGGIEQIHIMPDLTIWKCINNLECKQAHIGQIDSKGNYFIDDKKITKWQENNPFADERCKKCKMLPICWGGCPLKFIQNKKRVCIYEKDFDIFKIAQ